MHAFLITGKTEDERLAHAQEFLKDQGAEEVIGIEPEKEVHSIAAVRILAKNLRLKSPTKRGVVIKQAHKMTVEAANAFLKTLEEPPSNTIIILTAPTRESVLETIASRCQEEFLGNDTISIKKEELEEASKIFGKIMSAGVGDRIKFAEDLNERQEALNFVVGQMLATRKALLIGAQATGNPPTQRLWQTGRQQQRSTTANNVSTKKLTLLLTSLLQTKKDLESNVNVKLALTNLLLNYPNV